METTSGEQGEGIGERFIADAKAYADQTGKRLVAYHQGYLARLGFEPERQPDGSMAYVYAPGGLSTESAARICPTCGDPLKGHHGTFCPRCQWSEMDANLDSDPLGNPPDPTVDMHRGIQAAVKTSDKLHDFLMNPKSRPDLQTPEAQAFLQHLKTFYHNGKTDALMPWLTREWKKGRIHYEAPNTIDGTTFPQIVRGPGNEPTQYPNLRFSPRVFGREYNDAALTPPVLGHWADFMQANHPMRRDLGDINRHDIHSFSEQIQRWDDAMAQEAHEKALQGGQVVHTTPDNWTVRRLTNPEECSAEGEAMGHCVGGYGPAVERGDTLIYSLRDPKNSPHATAEIRPRRWQDPPGPNGEPGTIYGEDAGHRNPEFNMTPVPHGGEVVQIQGKGNREPIDEHKARLADWFRSFSPKDRPHRENQEEASMWDEDGYSHYRLDHPDLIPQYQEEFGGLAPSTEPVEDEYGLLHQRPSMPSDYEELLKNIHMRETNWNTTRGDTAHIKSIYLLAAERGELPELAEALEGYQQDQDQDFQNMMDVNWQYAPRYVDPEDPHGWEDEEGTNVDEGQGKPYWEPEGPADIGAPRYFDPQEAEQAYDRAYGEQADQHGGLDTANQFYTLLKPHYGPHPETGEQGYWNQLAAPTASPAPPQAPQAFAATIPSHRWFDAIEDVP